MDKKEDSIYNYEKIMPEAAALMLVRMGYENIKDFGGIEDWRYGTE